MKANAVRQGYATWARHEHDKRQVNTNPERNDMTHTNDRDLLHGMAAIAEHIGLSVRQVKHMHGAGQMPTFKIGRKVCALKSKLDAWLLAKSDEGSKPDKPFTWEGAL